MNKAVINIKTDTKTKKDAQKLADQFGVSLSSLVTMTLRNLVRTKHLDISLIPEVDATPDEIRSLKKGITEIQKGDYVTLAEL